MFDEETAYIYEYMNQITKNRAGGTKQIEDLIL